MKKNASTVSKPPLSRKSPASRVDAEQRAESSARADAPSCVRLEVTPPTSLAVLATPAPATPRRRVRFGYFKPDATEVFVVGSFNGWDPRITPLRRDAFGDWSIEIELPTGEHHYRFVVDGEWHDDPAAQLTARNPYGGFDAIMVVA